MSMATPAPPQNLAGVPENVEFEIVDSLLPGGLPTAGRPALRPGSRWRCRLNGKAIMLLHSPSGRMVSLRADEARYVQVRVLRKGRR